MNFTRKTILTPTNIGIGVLILCALVIVILFGLYMGGVFNSGNNNASTTTPDTSPSPDVSRLPDSSPTPAPVVPRLPDPVPTHAPVGPQIEYMNLNGVTPEYCSDHYDDKKCQNVAGPICHPRTHKCDEWFYQYGYACSDKELKSSNCSYMHKICEKNKVDPNCTQWMSGYRTQQSSKVMP